MLRRGIAGSSSSIVFNFLRNLQTDIKIGCTSLQSHQQWRSVPLSQVQYIFGKKSFQVIMTSIPYVQ
jgi:hypothetical protein